jgi:geranylgeranyl reductase family protein
MSVPMFDAVVVGGGPAGLYTAMRLGAEGFDVVVLEEDAEVGVPTHCTGVVSDELADLFKVPEPAVLNRPAVCRLVAPSGRAYALASPTERIAVIDRRRFDEELALAARQAGAEIRTGIRAERIEPGADAVRVRGAGGVLVTGRVCVLACGIGYGLPRGLGLGLPTLHLHSAQIELDAETPSEAVEVHVAPEALPEGFAWVVPVAREGRHGVKVGLVARGDALAALGRFVRRRGLGERLNGHLAHAVRRLLPLAPLPRTYAHRLLVVGDAAGLTKPTTGGGIFYSLLSASLAAETLVESLRRDRLGERDLERYETAWRARLGPHLRISTYVRRLFARLTPAELDTLLEAIASEEVQALIRQTARFNWHGGVIRAALRQRGVRSVLFRALLR